MVIFLIFLVYNTTSIWGSTPQNWIFLRRATARIDEKIRVDHPDTFLIYGAKDELSFRVFYDADIIFQRILTVDQSLAGQRIFTSHF